MIQKTYRGWVAADAFVTTAYCIVRIQRFLRGYFAQKRRVLHDAEREYEEIAATIIQAQWRSFSCEMKFLRFYEDLLIVQSVARGWITRRLIRLWLMAHNQKVSQLSKRSTDPQPVSTNRQQQQATPPRKTANQAAALSPSYQPHIEYMRKTLTPDSVPAQELSPQRVSIRKGGPVNHEKTNRVLSESSPASTHQKQDPSKQLQSVANRNLPKMAE